MANVASVSATFMASIKSVGTAVTMSAVGFYLHQRNFVTTEGKRALALMSQQVTFPLFLFTKIIYCNQDWSDKPCPDVTSTLHDTWMLLLWPLYMVGMGLMVGKLVVRFTQTPKHQTPSVLAACAFANNTALPITLLAVVHANFPATSDLGRIDPTLFLSVYLIVYPILQWGLGGYILAPPDDEENDNNSKGFSYASSTRQSLRRLKESIAHPRNVLNNKGMIQARRNRTNRLTSTDEGCYQTELNLEKLAQIEREREDAAWELDHMHEIEECEDSFTNNEENCALLMEDDPDNNQQYSSLDQTNNPFHTNGNYSNDNKHRNTMQQEEPLPPTPKIGHRSPASKNNGGPSTTTPTMLVNRIPNSADRFPNSADRFNNSKSLRTLASQYETETTWETIRNVLDRCINPPMIGAVLGIATAMTPGARGIFVDLVNRHSGAPLQWLFDGLYKVGQLAVPDNMLILGCNLSASYKNYLERRDTVRSDNDKEKDRSMYSNKTMAGIVIGKMLVMPLIGILSAYILQYYVLDIPDEIAGAFYLVLMIVFLTPTANNVMIMIELADADIGVLTSTANVIAFQYVVAPVLLSLTMTIAIGVASEWT